jgi:hypothetical protein
MEGLRAFEVLVGARAETRNPNRPIWVELNGQRQDVVAVDSEWREEDRLGYRVRLRDNTRMLLYYVPSADLWSGVVQHEG